MIPQYRFMLSITPESSLAAYIQNSSLSATRKPLEGLKSHILQSSPVSLSLGQTRMGLDHKSGS